ncbi:hypothetical protein BC834DRAFT_124141 [Gloeopeniophorella convolvens]|nr:hypothetical protein BC834DRAFT_124141 [Gloeopeniophorella convolvens]
MTYPRPSTVNLSNLHFPRLMCFSVFVDYTCSRSPGIVPSCPLPSALCASELSHLFQHPRNDEMCSRLCPVCSVSSHVTAPSIVFRMLLARRSLDNLQRACSVKRLEDARHGANAVRGTQNRTYDAEKSQRWISAPAYRGRYRLTRSQSIIG